MSCIDHIITYSRLSIAIIILSGEDGLFRERSLIITWGEVGDLAAGTR